MGADKLQTRTANMSFERQFFKKKPVSQYIPYKFPHSLPYSNYNRPSSVFLTTSFLRIFSIHVISASFCRTMFLPYFFHPWWNYLASVGGPILHNSWTNFCLFLMIFSITFSELNVNKKCTRFVPCCLSRHYFSLVCNRLMSYIKKI